MDSHQEALAINALENIGDVFKRLNVPMILWGRTLLGIGRDQKLISESIELITWDYYKPQFESQLLYDLIDEFQFKEEALGRYSKGDIKITIGFADRQYVKNPLYLELTRPVAFNDEVYFIPNFYPEVLSDIFGDWQNALKD
ncbi:MAG: hypothetical protein NTZ18_03815 [Candidatus Komeilibacteria bacterium]|nr:hypothetical protein [Candidatus Komeilibacteria bacterium]